jgi:hypothetical protein
MRRLFLSLFLGLLPASLSYADTCAPDSGAPFNSPFSFVLIKENLGVYCMYGSNPYPAFPEVPTFSFGSYAPSSSNWEYLNNWYFISEVYACWESASACEFFPATYQ